MGHNLLEQQPGRQPGPATEQGPEEIVLARELCGMMDNLLGEKDYRRFDFAEKGSLVLNPGMEAKPMIKDENHWFLVEYDSSLLSSKDWPDLKWTPMEAWISRKDNRLSISIEGYKNPHETSIGYGIHLVLDGTYLRINNIFPADSKEAVEEKWRRQDYEFIPSEPVPELRGRQVNVEIPNRDPKLRSRVNRLRYGIFILNRIRKTAAGNKCLSD